MKSLELRGVPRYVKLAEALRRDIARGKLKPGDRLPSFAETKARHGISQATWDKVHATLESEGLISREPGRGVFVAQPVVIEDAPRVPTGSIGLAGYGFGASGSSTYWASLLDGVREVAEAGGRQVVLLPLDGGPGWESADGAIVCNWTPSVTQRAPSELPLTWILVPYMEMSGARADEEGAIRELVEHLLGLGHRRIAYLHGRGMDEEAPRYKGYAAALKAAGVTPHESWLRVLAKSPGFGSEFSRSGHEAMQLWLENGWAETGCTAILAHNDETAIGVIGALREAGLGVPEDVSVAGFDGLEVGAYFSPPLTTMQMPLHEIGARAASLLIEEIEKTASGTAVNASNYEIITLPCLLQVRGSTAPPANLPPQTTASETAKSAVSSATKARAVSKRRV